MMIFSGLGTCPVTFPIKSMDDAEAEIVPFALPKWKRLLLAQLGIESGYG